MASGNLYIFLKKSSPAKNYLLVRGCNLYIFYEKLLSIKISFVIIAIRKENFSREDNFMKNV